jgi:hypothetical protein
MIKDLVIDRIIIAKYRIKGNELYLRILKRDLEVNYTALVISYISMLENTEIKSIHYLPIL